jgi:hypothetical protein
MASDAVCNGRKQSFPSMPNDAKDAFSSHRYLVAVLLTPPY